MDSLGIGWRETEVLNCLFLLSSEREKLISLLCKNRIALCTADFSLSFCCKQREPGKALNVNILFEAVGDVSAKMK